MGFSAPKKVDPPPLPDPVAEPETDEGSEIKKMRKRKGRLQTVLTGDLVPPQTGGTALGGRM